MQVYTHHKMKKILAILLMITSFAQAQKLEDMRSGGTTDTSAYMLLSKNKLQYKQSVGSFLNKYIPSVFTSLTTNYVPKAASATTLSNSLIYDNGTSVSIGNASPTASTAFEVKSTTGGFVFPRMTQTQRNALTPFDGMAVHNTTSFTYDGYAAGSWYNFIGTNLTNTADYYPKFVTSTTITNSLLKDSVDYVTTMSSGLTTRHFKYVDGNEGAAKVLTSDGSGNATWQAAAGTLTGATGDLISFSATNTQSNISAGATGTYLRFAGASTLPIVSTLVLPNSATANYIPYATSTNTWGESSNLDYASNCLRSLKVGAASTDVCARLGYVGFQSFASDNTIIGFNYTYNGGRYATGYSFYLQQYLGGLSFNPSTASAAAGSSASFVTHVMYVNGGGVSIGNGVTLATSKLHIGAGTATAGTSPLGFTDGTLLTVPVNGKVEAVTDRLTYTTATGTTRKDFNFLTYRGITALRTLDGSDELVNCTSGTYSVTLPTAVGYTQQYIVKNIGTGIITLVTTSSQTIDGYASGVLVLNQYDSYTLRSDNSNWIIIK